MNGFPQGMATAGRGTAAAAVLSRNAWPGRFQFTLADLFCASTYFCVSSAIGYWLPWLLPLLVLLSVPVLLRLRALCPIDGKTSNLQRGATLICCIMLEWTLATLALTTAAIAFCPAALAAFMLVGCVGRLVGEVNAQPLTLALLAVFELALMGAVYEVMRRATWPPKKIEH